MLKLNFIQTDEELLSAIRQLQLNISFEISEQGIPVILQSAEKGLTVIRSREEIRLEYASLNMLFRGILIIAANELLDEYRLVQDCCFEDFGIMVDLSRNAVMKQDALKELVRHLALLGYKSLQLYTEDTMVIEQEEYFGYMRGALKAEEIRELDRYCQSFGIELIPCIQCLAHLNQIKRYESYERFIDTDDILLAGDERTYKLLEHILQTIAHNFTSRKLNIGMDEAHMIGLGKYLDRFGYENRFNIMLKHLSRVKALCRTYGFEPRMWSDMFFRLVYGGDYYNNNEADQKLFHKIPEDIMLIYWDYYSCDYNRYADNLKKHKRITDKVGFAGGAWKWNGFAPDNEYSIKTGEAALKACKDQKIKSFLLTCWGDNGAEASIYSILPAIYYYAEQAYTEEFEKEKFKCLTGSCFDEFMKLDLPNRMIKRDGEHNNASKFFLYNDILIGTFDSMASPEIGRRYEEYAESLKQTQQSAGSYSYIFDTMKQLCSVLALKANLGNELKSAYDRKDIRKLREIREAVLPELIRRYQSFYQSFFTQWHRENKSFGFEVQCIRLGGLITRARYVEERLRSYLEGETERIEELEEKRKPFAYFENREAGNLSYNLWSHIVSPGVI